MIVTVFCNFCSPLAGIRETSPSHPLLNSLTAIASCKIIDHQPAIICNPNRLDALWHLLKPQTLFAGFSFPPFALFLQTDKCLDLGLIMRRNFVLAQLCLCWLQWGLAADGRLELITLNGENIIWPHWFSTRCCTLPLRNQHRRNAFKAGWGRITYLELSHFFCSINYPRISPWQTKQCTLLGTDDNIQL